jgi:hypothetical protein
MCYCPFHGGEKIMDLTDRIKEDKKLDEQRLKNKRIWNCAVIGITILLGVLFAVLDMMYLKYPPGFWVLGGVGETDFWVGWIIFSFLVVIFLGGGAFLISGYVEGLVADLNRTPIKEEKLGDLTIETYYEAEYNAAEERGTKSFFSIMAILILVCPLIVLLQGVSRYGTQSAIMNGQNFELTYYFFQKGRVELLNTVPKSSKYGLTKNKLLIHLARGIMYDAYEYRKLVEMGAEKIYGEEKAKKVLKLFKHEPEWFKTRGEILEYFLKGADDEVLQAVVKIAFERFNDEWAGFGNKLQKKLDNK